MESEHRYSDIHRTLSCFVLTGVDPHLFGGLRDLGLSQADKDNPEPQPTRLDQESAIGKRKPRSVRETLQQVPSYDLAG